MQSSMLEGGFLDVPVQSAQAFRQIMTAMAQPGHINTVVGATPPAPLSSAAGVVILTMCDPETPLFLAPSVDTPEVRAWVTFHTGAPFATPENAAFAVGVWDELPLTQFAIGTPEYPDRSTTLIVEMSAVIASGATLRGPGIKNTTQLSLPDVPAMQANATLFPLGCDFILTCGDQLAALPRSTRID